MCIYIYIYGERERDREYCCENEYVFYEIVFMMIVCCKVEGQLSEHGTRGWGAVSAA